MYASAPSIANNGENKAAQYQVISIKKSTGEFTLYIHDLCNVNSTIPAGATTYVANNIKVGNVYYTIPSGGTPAWGDITGTLSNQTDLKTALDNCVKTTMSTQTIGGKKTFNAGTLHVTDNFYIDASSGAPGSPKVGFDNRGVYLYDDQNTVKTSIFYPERTTSFTTKTLATTDQIPAAQVNSDWNANSGVAQILNKPTLAAVATSGSYNDLTDKPTIPVVDYPVTDVQVDGTSVLDGTVAKITSPDLSNYVTSTDLSTALADYTETSDLAAVALSNDYDDLDDKPDLSIYAESSDLATVATTGDYTDLINTPDLSDMATETWVGQQGYLTSVSWNDVSSKPSFATVATSGDYDDLTNKPTIPAAQVNSDWNAVSGVAQILNKPTIPVVPTNVSDFTNDAGYITSSDIPITDVTVGGTSVVSSKVAVIPALFSGDYNDLTNKPTIPAAQVNADWNSSSGVSEILNKPTLAAVATSGAYSDLTGTPTIPAAVSGTNDGTNWTTLTIGSDTYDIPAGSTPSHMVTTNTSQTITARKTFSGSDPALVVKPSTSSGKASVKLYTYGDNEVGFFQYHPTNNQIVFGASEAGVTDVQLALRQYKSSGAYSVKLPLCANKTTDIGSGDLTMPLGIKVGTNSVVTAGTGGVVELPAYPDISGKLDATMCTYQTTAPTAAATDGGVHIVYLSAEPATKYAGYIYMIAES